MPAAGRGGRSLSPSRIALPTAIDAAAVATRDRAAPVATHAGKTMGTTWQVSFARPPQLDPAAVERAIVARLAGLVGEMSHWIHGSLLARFNRAPAKSWMALPPDFATVIAAALHIAEASDGAFDPAIGQLVDLWGFGPPGGRQSPDTAEIEAALVTSRWRRLAFDRGARRLLQPGGLALDLSGIAKGYGVDAIADLLADMGISHCLVEIGGELVGRGMKPDGEPWWVDLETPPGMSLPPLRIALHQLAVATSGSYRCGDHTIDPRNGRPAANGIVSVSVIHDSAMAADAWASALTVLGAKAGLALAAQRGLAARIVERCGREHLSPALLAMLKD